MGVYYLKQGSEEEWDVECKIKVILHICTFILHFTTQWIHYQLNENEICVLFLSFLASSLNMSGNLPDNSREHCVFLWFPTFRQDNSYPFSFSCSVDLRKFAKDGFLCRGHAVTSDKLHNNNNGYCAENEKRDKKGRKTMSSMPWAEHKKPFLCWKKSISRMRDRNRGAMHAFAHVL